MYDPYLSESKLCSNAKHTVPYNAIFLRLNSFFNENLENLAFLNMFLIVQFVYGSQFVI